MNIGQFNSAIINASPVGQHFHIRVHLRSGREVVGEYDSIISAPSNEYIIKIRSSTVVSQWSFVAVDAIDVIEFIKA